MVFSDSFQPLLEASALKLLCPCPWDASRHLGVFWAHHRSLWMEWPGCQHSLPPPTAHGNDLNWNSNPSSQLFSESCSKEDHLGTCLWLWVACVYASDQGALCREQGKDCPSYPAADWRFDLHSMPSSIRVWQGPVPQSLDVSFNSDSSLTSYMTLSQHPNPLWDTVASTENRDPTSLGDLL